MSLKRIAALCCAGVLLLSGCGKAEPEKIPSEGTLFLLEKQSSAEIAPISAANGLPTHFFCQSPDGKTALLGRPEKEGTLCVPFLLNLDSGELTECPTGLRLDSQWRIRWADDGNLYPYSLWKGTDYRYFTAADFSEHSLTLPYQSGVEESGFVCRDTKSGNFLLFHTMNRESLMDGSFRRCLSCATLGPAGEFQSDYDTGLVWREVDTGEKTEDTPAEFLVSGGKVYFSYVSEWYPPEKDVNNIGYPSYIELIEYDPSELKVKVLGSYKTALNTYGLGQRYRMGDVVKRVENGQIAVMLKHEAFETPLWVDLSTKEQSPAPLAFANPVLPDGAVRVGESLLGGTYYYMSAK